MNPDPATPDRCPRCGGSFACGAAGPGRCACTTVTLGPALQARLRREFQGCLCLDCLQALAVADAAAAAPPQRN
ncbi:MAG: cysteine-rich CWC family protein [Rubrivivax sp.]|nr:cysteine-rich CWC family protein [Rubrivivax sp.]